MATLRETTEELLLAHHIGITDDVEFLLLFDLNKSKNPDYPYWSYDAFDLDSLTNDERK